MQAQLPVFLQVPEGIHLATLVGMFVYKGIKLQDIPGIIQTSSFTTAAVMFCVATTNILAWALTSEQVISKLSAAMLLITYVPQISMLLPNLF